MYNISGFLQKFLNLEKDNNTKILLILEAVKKSTNIDLERNMLDMKGDNLRINCNPVMRNEIFMHKSQIEDFLKQQKIFLNIV